MPTPDSATACRLLGALSVIETLAVRLPPVAGAKVTEIVQDALGLSVAGAVGQLLLSAKSEGFAPAIAIAEIVRGPAPLLVSVVDCGALVVPRSRAPKLRLVGASATAGAGSAPVPLSATVCGLPAASSATERLALRLPLAVGLKVTEIVHAAPAASVLGLSGQVLVCAKSSGFVPARPMPLIVSGALPLFVSIVDCAGLVVPLVWEPKVRLVGVSATAGAAAAAVPERSMLCRLPAASSATVSEATRLPGAPGEKVTEIEQLAPTASVLGARG